VLSLPSVEEARAEIARIGPSLPALGWLADKASVRAMRLEGVRGKAAAILKQELLAVGGDCVVSPQVANFDDSPRPVILLATIRQYEHLLPKLRRQPLGLAHIADQVHTVLEHYEQHQRPALRCPQGEIVVGQRTVVMGIINMTPDSFAGDGISGSDQAALQQAKDFAANGADIIDIGGESTRPGSEGVGVAEELERVLPALDAIRPVVNVPISIDTTKAEVARIAVAHGADIINALYGVLMQQ